MLVAEISKAPNHTCLTSLYSIESLQETINLLRERQGLSKPVSHEDVLLLIRYMQQKNMLVIKNVSNDEKIVRVRKLNESGPLNISEEQINIKLLQVALIRMEASLDNLTRQIQDLKGKIVEFLRQKDKSMALFLLKKSKKLEERRAHQLQCHDTLESILLKIETAKTDAQVYILPTYQSKFIFG